MLYTIVTYIYIYIWQGYLYIRIHLCKYIYIYIYIYIYPYTDTMLYGPFFLPRLFSCPESHGRSWLES